MRTALITGGTGGLGVGVLEAFLESGWRCVVPWHAEAEVERARERPEIAAAGERVAFVQADLFDEEAVRGVVAAADGVDEAPLEAAVNLVGGFDAGPKAHETPVQRFETQLRLNLRATYLVSAAALGAMLPRGRGAVVCVSSRSALRPFAGAGGYVTSKAAVLALVDALATEYTAEGLRVNAVLPSVIDTPGNRKSMPDADWSRWVSPAQIGRVIEFLCSDAGEPISGAHVPVYGRA